MVFVRVWKRPMVEKSSPVAVPREEPACQRSYFRLNKAYQFQELSKHGKTFKTENFLVRFVQKDSGGLGFAVKATKKNFKKAHDRNYAKRRLRHLVYVTKPQIHGHMVLIAHKGIVSCHYANLLASFGQFIQNWSKK
jgi:ribonuclease P protein component